MIPWITLNRTTIMNTKELKDAISLKTFEFEGAMAAQRPHNELMTIYKELKELKYQLVLVENIIQTEKDLDLA
jgi:hypothetical protein